MAPFPPQAPNRIPTRADVPEESLWSGAPPSAASTFVPVGPSGASSTSYSEVTSLGAQSTNGDSLRDISDIIAPLTIGGDEQSVQSGANARLGDESITDKVDVGSTCTGDSDNEPQHQDCDLSPDSVTAGCPHAEDALQDPNTAEEICRELIKRKGGGGKGGGGGGGAGGKSKLPPKPPSSTPNNKGTGPDGSVPVGTSGTGGTGTENSSETHDSSSHNEDDDDHNKEYIIGGVVGGVVGVALIGGIWWYIRKDRQKKLKQRSNNSDPVAEAASNGGLLLCIACC